MSILKYFDLLVRRATVRIIVGAAYRAVDLSSWLCSKLFGIPTSHILIVMSDIESKKVMTLQNAQVLTTHTGDALALLRDHHEGMAQTIIEKDAERFKLKAPPVTKDPTEAEAIESHIVNKVGRFEVRGDSLVVLDCKAEAIEREDFRRSLHQVSERLGCHMLVTGNDIRQVTVHSVPENGVVVLHADKEPANPRFARTLQEQLRRDHGDKVRVSVMVAKPEATSQPEVK